ncbi:cytochrome c-550 PedF [Paracoccus kondratievae]|nr:cytochrome c-550 PedF [Paracoccus kondratievae]
MTSRISKIFPLALSLAFWAPMALGHGDTAPQAVDTTGLPELPAEMATQNPWREAEGEVLFKAVEIGAKGFNSNCARCHGLEAISGGLAPDLRFLEASEYGDEWFLDRILHGYEQNGAVKMPPFEGILNQQAIWAIRTYIETRPDADAIAGKSTEIAALYDKVKALPPDAGEDQIAALARELETAGSGFEALSGAPRTVTVLDQAAHILRSGASHAPAAAELIQSVLRK